MRLGYETRNRLDRRAVLRVGFRLGVFIGLSMLGLFRSVRTAAADYPYGAHPTCGSYDPDSWNGFDGDNNGWFEPGTCDDDTCVGVPDDAMGSWYCTTCAEVSDHNPYGWHFTGRRGPFLYGDQPDLCNVGGVSPRRLEVGDRVLQRLSARDVPVSRRVEALSQRRARTDRVPRARRVQR